MLLRLKNFHGQDIYIEYAAIVAIVPRNPVPHLSTDLIVGVNTVITMRGSPDDVVDQITEAQAQRDIASASLQAVTPAPAPAPVPIQRGGARGRAAQPQ